MQNNFAGPTSIPEAVAELAAAPEALVVAGGTDVMLALAAGRVHAPAIVALTWLAELARWERRPDGSVRVGATLTCAHARTLADVLPALAQAAAAMGTPQIRNAATVGGNLASAAGGDLLPVLSACRAVVELASAAGVREVGVDEFLGGLGEGGARATSMRPGELITAVTVPPVRGAQEFCRVAVRGAGAPALLSMAVVLDVDAGELRAAFVRGGPRGGPRGGGRAPVRARAAEAVLTDHLRAHPGVEPPEVAAAEFARLAGEAAGPDAYLRRAVGVCAGRLLGRVFAGASRG
jgi:CO/xanthine dehydrogenase FAD-binding subunit